jgi:hypothetical protein
MAVFISLGSGKLKKKLIKIATEHYVTSDWGEGSAIVGVLSVADLFT